MYFHVDHLGNSKYRARVEDAGVIIETFEFDLLRNGLDLQEQAKNAYDALKAPPPPEPTPEDPAKIAWSNALSKLRSIQFYVSLGIVPADDPRITTLISQVRDGLSKYGDL